MQIIAHGIDLVDFPRIEEMLQRHGKRFLDRVFTRAEQAYADDNKNGIEKSLLVNLKLLKLNICKQSDQKTEHGKIFLSSVEKPAFAPGFTASPMAQSSITIALAKWWSNWTKIILLKSRIRYLKSRLLIRKRQI